MKCEDCKYFQYRDKGVDCRGQCRKYAPKRFIKADNWPWVKDYDWCGEFQAKERNGKKSL